MTNSIAILNNCLNVGPLLAPEEHFFGSGSQAMLEDVQFLRRKAAATYLLDKYGFGAERTLAKGVVTGDSPVYHKAGRLVLYTRQALDAWALGKIGPLRRSSSDDVERSEPTRGLLRTARRSPDLPTHTQGRENRPIMTSGEALRCDQDACPRGANSEMEGGDA